MFIQTYFQKGYIIRFINKKRFRRGMVKLLVKKDTAIIDDDGTIIDAEIIKDIYTLLKQKAKIEKSLNYYSKK